MLAIEPLVALTFRFVGAAVPVAPGFARARDDS